MSADRHWLLTFEPDTAMIDVIGPFTSQDRAAEAGRRWQEASGGSPCWNTLCGKAAVVVFVSAGESA